MHYYETARRWTMLVLGSGLAVYQVTKSEPNPYALAFIAGLLSIHSFQMFKNNGK